MGEIRGPSLDQGGGYWQYLAKEWLRARRAKCHVAEKPTTPPSRRPVGDRNIGGYILEKRSVEGCGFLEGERRNEAALGPARTRRFRHDGNATRALRSAAKKSGVAPHLFTSAPGGINIGVSLGERRGKARRSRKLLRSHLPQPRCPWGHTVIVACY